MSQQLDLPPSYSESLQDPALPAGEAGSTTAPAEEEDSACRDGKKPSLLDALESADSAGPSSSSPAPPPEYAWYDPAGVTFTLGPPWIITNTGAPRYQLQQRHPFQLHIRPLLAAQSRLLAAAGATIGPGGSGTVPRRWVRDPTERLVDVVPYDNDAGLYMVYIFGAIMNPSAEIHGLRPPRSLSGHIEMERCIPRVLVRGGGCRFWHMARNRGRDTLLEDNQRRAQRNRRLLFDVMGTNGFLGGASAWEWKDIHGRVVATEGNRTLNLTAEMPQKTKDTLIACWIAKVSASGFLRFDEYVQEL